MMSVPHTNCQLSIFYTMGIIRKGHIFVSGHSLPALWYSKNGGYIKKQTALINGILI